MIKKFLTSRWSCPKCCFHVVVCWRGDINRIFTRCYCNGGVNLGVGFIKGFGMFMIDKERRFNGHVV